jgi:anaerobic selenocysteine-containing dehydrogenase
VREFGGTLGASVIISLSHILMFYLWIAWRFHDGALFYPAGLAAELDAAHRDMQDSGDPDYPFLMVSRRMKNTYNSTGPELELLGAKGTTNPAYVNPADLAGLGIADGELIELRSRHGRIPAVAAASEDVKAGVVSISHCWGGSPDPARGADQKVREIGTNTNRLIDNLERPEKYSGMPRQSTVPVTIARLVNPAPSAH